MEQRANQQVYSDLKRSGQITATEEEKISSHYNGQDKEIKGILGSILKLLRGEKTAIPQQKVYAGNTNG